MNTTSEYVTGMQAQLKAWDANVAVLLTESRKADGEARTAYAKRLKELRLSRKAAQKSLEALRAATGATAAKSQAAMQETWDSMQKSLEKVSTELRGMTRGAQAPEPAQGPEPAPAPEPAEPPQAAQAQIPQETAP